MGFLKLYHDFVTLFAGRYGNYNSVVIWSLSIDIFEILGYEMLVIRIILLTFEYRLKTLYSCFWYFKKRRGDSFSSEVAFIFQMTYNKVFKFLAAVRGYHYYRRFGFLKKVKSLNAFLKLITHLIALQSKYAKLEMKMQLAVFLEKYHALRNFSWIGEPL